MSRKEELKQKFIKLVQEEGYKEELETFDYCTSYGVMLEDSTIDKITISGDNITFYFNENTGDCATFGEFTYRGLMDFYKGLKEAIKEENEYAYMENMAEGACAMLG